MYIHYIYIFVNLFMRMCEYILVMQVVRCKAIKLVPSSLSNNEVVSVETICQGKKTILKTCQVTEVN